MSTATDDEQRNYILGFFPPGLLVFIMDNHGEYLKTHSSDFRLSADVWLMTKSVTGNQPLLKNRRPKFDFLWK